MKNIAPIKASLALGIAAAVAALSPLAAQAADFGTAPTMTVKYSDLDLNTEAGALVLYRRLAKAADDVCPADSKSLGDHSRHTSCTRDALTSAVRAVNRDSVSKLYASRTGIDVAPALSMNVR